MALLGIVNASGAFDTALCSWRQAFLFFMERWIELQSKNIQ